MENHELSRKYEGPAELLYEGVNKRDIFSRKDMPGGQSVADTYTVRYGEQGIGWDIDSDRYAKENQLKDELHAPEFNLAQEGLKNAMAMQRYESKEGINLHERKVRTFVREADKVDILVYPDGKMYEVKKFRS
jgi:hypothetical protein